MATLNKTRGVFNPYFMNRAGLMDDEKELIKQKLQKPVCLVGMMGAGKSRMGRELSAALALDFYDTDKMIEESAGRSVAEVFSDFGEEKFREAEKNTLLALLDKGPCVIATGGGAVTNPEALSLMKDRTLMIWLRADLDTILERVTQKDTRPLLRGGDPRAILEELLEKRKPLYEQAHIIVESTQAAREDTLQAIIKELYAQANSIRF